jgi:hypothetical protein
VHYQFSRPLSLRAILDYNSLSPNPSFVTRQAGKHMTGDVLFTYLVNPGTAIYVGYNNQFDNLAIQATTPPSLIRTRSPSLSTGSQFYVKVSYMLRQ